MATSTITQNAPILTLPQRFVLYVRNMVNFGKLLIIIYLVQVAQYAHKVH